MADEVNLSFSYSTSVSTGIGAPSSQPASPRVDAERYAFACCDTVQVDTNSVLVLARHNGRQQLLAPQAVSALTGCCASFQTLEEHAKTLVRRRPELGGNLVNARAVLSQLAEAGLLLRASEVCRELDRDVAHDGAASSRQPTRAFIITCDRPSAVERLLESMLSGAQLSTHEQLFLVDDSRQESSAAANRDALARFNLRSPREMRYLGRAERRRLLSALIAACPEYESGIRFLLDAEEWQGTATYGLSRTLCLLLSVGKRAIILDDDVLCRALHPPIDREGVDLSMNGRREAAFYSSLDDMFGRVVDMGFDPLEGHAKFLGAPVGATLRLIQGNRPLSAGDLAGGDANSLAAMTAGSRILLTQCGSFGDPGIPSPHWVLELGQDSVDRLLSAPHGLSMAMQNRCQWLGAPRYQIFKDAYLSQITGLDNSALLPPYFPAFRGEDLLFGAMLEVMHHDSAVLEYPWAVPHLPVDNRHMLDIKAPIARASGMSLLTRQLTRLIDLTDPVRPRTRLDAIADAARTLAARESAQLLLDYRREQARIHSERYADVRQKIEDAEHTGNASWVAYLRRALDETQQALVQEQSPASLAPTTTGGGGEERALALAERLRVLASGWAEGLDAWCAIREWAAVNADRYASELR